MKQLGNVSALMDISGMVLLAWFNLSAVVAKSGMKKNSNANALITLIGMEASVSCA